MVVFQNVLTSPKFSPVCFLWYKKTRQEDEWLYWLSWTKSFSPTLPQTVARGGWPRKRKGKKENQQMFCFLLRFSRILSALGLSEPSIVWFFVCLVVVVLGFFVVVFWLSLSRFHSVYLPALP